MRTPSNQPYPRIATNNGDSDDKNIGLQRSSRPKLRRNWTMGAQRQIKDR